MYTNNNFSRDLYTELEHDNYRNKHKIPVCCNKKMAIKLQKICKSSSKAIIIIIKSFPYMKIFTDIVTHVQLV